MMTERERITAMIIGGVFGCVLISSLAWIAVVKGDGSESLIVAMMVGLPTLIFSNAALLFGHSKSLDAVKQTITANTTNQQQQP